MLFFLLSGATESVLCLSPFNLKLDSILSLIMIPIRPKLEMSKVLSHRHRAAVKVCAFIKRRGERASSDGKMP